jgi:hypothetical protein
MKTLRSMLSRFRRLTLIQRYALATALTVLAAGGQWALTPNLDSHPLLLFGYLALLENHIDRGDSSHNESDPFSFPQSANVKSPTLPA